MIRRADMTRKPELPEGDDGRTIVNMNVDGMPWYTPGKRLSREERRQKAQNGPAMTREESRYYTWGAVRAALLVVGVMCAGIILFVLFCTEIWFK